MDLSRMLTLKGSVETTAQELLCSVLPRICAMNSSLGRAYFYVEEGRAALGERRREKPAMTIKPGGAIIADSRPRPYCCGGINLYRSGPRRLA